MPDKPDIRALGAAIKRFDELLNDAQIDSEVAKEIARPLRQSEVCLRERNMIAADAALAAALLAIKRNLGTEISLRHGFNLSSILVEDLRAHFADPAVLMRDAADFAQTFFRIYSSHDFRGPGLPDYLLKRPYPKTPDLAAAQLISTIGQFCLPRPQLKILTADIEAIAKNARAFGQGKATAKAQLTHNVLVATLAFDLFDLQGIYLTDHQVMTVLGLVVFAVPAWLCAAPPAWIAQAIIAVLGLAIYGIYRLMQTPAAKQAYKDMWVYIEDCTKSVRQSLAELRTKTAGLTAAEKADLKAALQATLTKVGNDTVVYSGQKNQVGAKLRALIAAL